MSLEESIMTRFCTIKCKLFFQPVVSEGTEGLLCALSLILKKKKKPFYKCIFLVGYNQEGKNAFYEASHVEVK